MQSEHFRDAPVSQAAKTKAVTKDAGKKKFSILSIQLEAYEVCQEAHQELKARGGKKAASERAKRAPTHEQSIKISQETECSVCGKDICVCVHTDISEAR